SQRVRRPPGHYPDRRPIRHCDNECARRRGRTTIGHGHDRGCALRRAQPAGHARTIEARTGRFHLRRRAANGPGDTACLCDRWRRGGRLSVSGADRWRRKRAAARCQPHSGQAERNDPMTAARETEWTSHNQAYLVAMLDRVRRGLERHLQRTLPEASSETDPGPLSASSSQDSALEILAARFGLSSFERDLLVLCAGVELDAGFAALCREAGAGSGPTFSLALAALPQPHWSALTPSGPLRYWKMIEVGPGDVLVNAPLRI